MHLLGESIQEVTLCAWPIVWADRYKGEEVIEIPPTDQGYEEFKSYM